MTSNIFSNTVHSSWNAFFIKNQSLLDIILNKIGDNYTPSKGEIFKVFEQPKEKIRFVIVGQDPYKQPGHATGRSFERNVASWKEACSTNPSIEGILRSLFYYEFNVFANRIDVIEKADISEWNITAPNQFFKSWEKDKGVFFLNKSLTTKIGTSNSHKDLWSPFIKEVVKEVSENAKITWLLWGKEANMLIRYINPKSTILTSIHPAAFSFVSGDEALKRMRQFILNSGLDRVLDFKHSIKTETEISKRNNLNAQIHDLEAELERLKTLKEREGIVPFIDPVIESIQKEILLLENELLNLENDKAEAEKLISDYNFRLNIELGDLILEILKLKKFIVEEDSEEYKEAKENEERFKYQYRNEQQRELIHLSEKEQKKIKSLRNEAAKLCHPDKFQHESEEIKRKAKQISQDLNKAYRNNDLKKVEELLALLKIGELDFSEKTSTNSKEKLTQQLEHLKNSIQNIKTELKELKESEVYRKIEAIEYMDEYFNKLREELEAELISLKEKNRLKYC